MTDTPPVGQIYRVRLGAVDHSITAAAGPLPGNIVVVQLTDAPPPGRVFREGLGGVDQSLPMP